MTERESVPELETEAAPMLVKEDALGIEDIPETEDIPVLEIEVIPEPEAVPVLETEAVPETEAVVNTDPVLVALPERLAVKLVLSPIVVSAFWEVAIVAVVAVVAVVAADSVAVVAADVVAVVAVDAVAVVEEPDRLISWVPNASGKLPNSIAAPIAN